MNSYKSIIPIILCLFLVQLNISAQKRSKIKKIQIDGETCTLPVLEEVQHHYLPYKFKNGVRKIDTRQAMINFSYGPNVPQEAKVALEDGVRPILRDFLFSDVPINLSVSFLPLGETTLAQARPNGYYIAYPNIPKLGVFYPVALAEKIARRDLNGEGEVDIVITASSEQNWYYDFNKPAGIGNKFDFVTIILHEVIHGLGFSAASSYNPANSAGFINNFSADGYSRFTDLMYLSSGIKVSDIQDGSAEMGLAFTGNNLFHRVFSQEIDAKLYAPAIYSTGSSVSHLDENTFNNTNSSLMTPFLNPGVIELGLGLSEHVLYDMGWNFTYVLHEIQPATEKSIILPYEVLIKIESDAGVDPDNDNVILHFSDDEFMQMDSIIPMSMVSQDSFSAMISSLGKEGEVQYYFEVKDRRNQTFYSPGVDIDDTPFFYTYYFGNDRVAPTILHQRIESLDDSQNSIFFECTVDDNFTGVDSVFLEWKVNGSDFKTITLLKDEENQFVDNKFIGILELQNPLVADDLFEYRLYATDKAIVKNVGRTPRGSNTFKVTVVPSLKPTLVYVNDFDVESNDFTGNFSIIKPIGFANPALHSPHPYQEAGINATIDYISELKVPIIVDETHPIIEFDEVVLVEQGEPGTTFGVAEFWDYVIVEARLQSGVTWQRLLDGYDSRANSEWLTSYTTGIPSGGQNSSTTGDLTLFKNRTIDITERGFFEANDTIIVRFRLFSDEAAAGWGWAIDNLKIQQFAVSSKDIELDNLLQIYPNPITSDEIFIKIGDEYGTELEASIFTIDGKMLTQFYLNGDKSISFPYDRGNYLLRIRSNKGIVTRKIIKL